MKYLVCIILLFNSTLAFASDPHVVFDIDWTITYTLGDDLYGIDRSRVIKVEGVYYRIADGVEEVIEDLIENKKVNVSFFSGGAESRNIELLKKIKLPNSGKSLYDIAYKVKSYKDLTVISTDKNLSFANRFKKDLRIIHPDLNNIILIDDLPEFALKGQNKNMLNFGKGFNFSEQFKPDKAYKHYALNNREWLAERMKILSAKDAIDNALLDLKNKKGTFVESISGWSKRLNYNSKSKSSIRRAFISSSKLAYKLNIKSLSQCLIWY